MKINPVFVPLSFGCAPKIARQQGVIKSNEIGFAEILEKELTRLSPDFKKSEKIQKVKSSSFSGNHDEEVLQWFYI